MLYTGCLCSACAFVHSVSVATSRLIFGDAISLGIHKFSILLDFKHPVVSRRVSFVALSTFFGMYISFNVELLHIEQAYSAAEKHNAMADMRNLSGSAPHLDPTNICIIPFLAFTVFVSIAN